MRRKGFTIIELLMTLLIMGLLMAAASLSLNAARQSGRDSRRLSDVLLIGSAIDQSASLNRGQFPNRASGGSASVLCANEIVATGNTQGIDLGVFPNRTIPTDPQAVTPLTTGCATYQNGYTYHNNYGPSIATDASLTFVLEVGLERAKSTDEAAFVNGQGFNLSVVTSPRYRYFLAGRSCGNSCY